MVRRSDPAGRLGGRTMGRGSASRSGLGDDSTPSWRRCNSSFIVTDAQGNLVAQRDGPLGRWPDEAESAWTAGSLLRQRIRLPVPSMRSGAVTGAYQIYVGLYTLQTLERLPLKVNGAVTPEEPVSVALRRTLARPDAHAVPGAPVDYHVCALRLFAPRRSAHPDTSTHTGCGRSPRTTPQPRIRSAPADARPRSGTGSASGSCAPTVPGGRPGGSRSRSVRHPAPG